MRVAVVQIQPAACAIGANIQAHEAWVKKCAGRGADMVFSLLEEHCAAAVALGVTVYVASVANTANGIAKSDAHYPSIARRHSLPVLMPNCVGTCDDFEAAGGSSVWNTRGELLARLPSSGEGALLLDPATNETLAIA